MSDHLNDTPISDSQDDLYDVANFARLIAKSIKGVKNPEGNAIALHGEWGSGKTSVVNLIRSKLTKEDDGSLIVSCFKGWWYDGEEALALAFLQNLNSTLNNTLTGEAKQLVQKISKKLLQAGPLVGAAMGLIKATAPGAGLIEPGADFISSFFSEEETLESLFNKLTEALQNQGKRFLIIIDDIDRLAPEEQLAIFKLVKSVGQLPNVLYLLVFDRLLADKAITHRYPSENAHYLDKIIQASFEIPKAQKTDILRHFGVGLEQICGPIARNNTHFGNVFHDVVSPYLELPRHVTRLLAALSITLPAVAGEVNIADFVAIETIRLYEPTLFHQIRRSQDRLCGVEDDRTPLDENRFEPYTRDIPVKRQQQATTALKRLFPRLEEIRYGTDFLQDWKKDLRICSKRHFDTYFRLSAGTNSVTTKDIKELINNAGDAEFVARTFRRAAAATRSNGISLIPEYLEQLTTYADEILKEAIPVLLSTLFELHDTIDLPGDDTESWFNTTTQYHWLIRAITMNRYSLAERTELYQATTANASLGWLVDFVSAARGHYIDRPKGPKREDECLVVEDSIPFFTALALDKINKAAADGSLLTHQDLTYILYRWRDFKDGDATDVYDWTTSQLNDDKAVIALAKAFAGKSYSQNIGLFGDLSDRVARVDVRLHINGKTDIINVERFIAALENIVSHRTMDQESLDIAETFLNAWQEQRRLRGKAEAEGRLEPA